MNEPPRVYLDNAATSWPKPSAVYEAVEHYLRHVGAPAGRSTYREAAQAESLVQSTRAAVARLIAAEHARQVVFTLNGTDALNLAIHGVLRPGDHVVTTVCEHNSVLRPLRNLEDSGAITVTRVGCNAAGQVDPDDVRAALRPKTRLVAVVHASNVTGTLQPVAEIGRIVREHDALLLVDAAQSLGHVPIDVRDLGIDLLAAPGHKGLLGPLGTGLLYIAPAVESHLASIRQGGTGSQSQSDRQPQTLPDKYEAGNLNVPGIAGLGAGVAYLAQRGLEAVRQHDLTLTGRLLDALRSVEGATIHGPQRPEDRVGVVSLTLDGYDPQEAAAMLDGSHRVQTRPGLHCAPLMHQALGTAQRGGTLRLSLGCMSSQADVETAVEAIGELAAANRTT